ncbi:hypothetical protein GVAMD_0109 [Gardnerella vaginalis AMD]|nr:hypothetical protein GVAMD_0109 [Gardnerella vaginalis AMD]
MFVLALFLHLACDVKPLVLRRTFFVCKVRLNVNREFYQLL